MNMADLECRMSVCPKWSIGDALVETGRIIHYVNCLYFCLSAKCQVTLNPLKIMTIIPLTR